MARDPIDELFTGPSEEFVTRRDALMKELKAAGDKRAAAEVKKLRRPTVAAWAVNQLAHHHPGKLAELDDVGQELRDAHEALLDGKGNETVRTATASRRRVVDQLVGLAIKAIGPGGEAQRDAITNTLDAAVADPDALEAVMAGRLSRELDPPAGFAGLPFAPGAPIGAKPKPERATAKSGAEDDRAAKREREEEARQRAQEKARERERRQRQAESDRADAAAEAAAAEVERLERRLSEARGHLAEAEERAVRARGALDHLD